MEELRQQPGNCSKAIREEASKRGRLVTTWQQYGIIVQVLDVSRFGARIELATSVKLPPILELWLDDEGLVHSSRVCWRRNNQVGIEFTGQPARATTKVFAELSRCRMLDEPQLDAQGRSGFLVV